MAITQWFSSSRILRECVQFATNLAQSNWFNLGGPFVATNSINQSVDTIGPDPRRFYRVKILP